MQIYQDIIAINCWFIILINMPKHLRKCFQLWTHNIHEKNEWHKKSIKNIQKLQKNVFTLQEKHTSEDVKRREFPIHKRRVFFTHAILEIK